MFPLSVPGLRAGLLLTVCASFSLSGAHADMIRMKNGEKLEGTITQETPEEVTIEVKIGNIKDWPVRKKKDIAEIVKSTPDEIEAVELRKLVPSPDGKTDVDYQRDITEKLEPFLKKYPVSRYRKEVEEILKTYQDEMAKAKAGAQKLEGQWVSPEEMDWNRYNIEARLKRIEMDKQIKSKEFYKAYRTYLELEKDKPASVEYPVALERVKEVLPKLDRELEIHGERQPQLAKDSAAMLKSLNQEARRQVEEARKAELAEVKLLQDEARKAKVPIPPYHVQELKSIQDARTQIIREQARLNKLDVEKIKANTAQFQQGLKLMHEKNYSAALKELEAAGRAFQKDPYVKDRVDVASKAAKEEKLANAMSGGVTVPTTMGAASTAANAATTQAADAKPKTPAKTAAGAPVKPPTPPVAATTPPEEEEDNNNIVMILLGAAGVLVVAGIIAKVAGKKKAAAAE